LSSSSSLMPEGLTPEQLLEFMSKLRTESHFRSKFSQPATAAEARRAVRLSSGPAEQRILAFPAPLALCGPQQYTKLGRAFRDVRDVMVLTIPGFVGKEELPADLPVALEDHAVAIQRANEGSAAPPVLMGYSSGGKFAHGLAAHLERTGRPVAAVVLLDSYPVDGTLPSPQVEGVLLTLLNSPEWRVYLNDTRLTAMGWYVELALTWPLEPIEAPILLVRAEEPMAGALQDEGDWRPKWPVEHDLVDVPGDHYSMLQENADSTMEAVEKWLLATLE
jgi:pimaricinolide synthase PimS1